MSSSHSNVPTPEGPGSVSGVDQNFITTAEDPRGVTADDTHVYWGDLGSDSIGRANMDGTGVDPNFIAGASAWDVFVSLGKVKKNERRGTAKITAKVPVAGELRLAENRKVKGTQKGADAVGKEKLPVKPKGKAKKQLNETGKAKVTANVTYTPEGGTANTESKRIKLVKR
jgi:hypothetical protein